MDLENYWKVLANPKWQNARWIFYDNGYFAAQKDGLLTVFSSNGIVLTTCSSADDFICRKTGETDDESHMFGRYNHTSNIWTVFIGTWCTELNVPSPTFLDYRAYYYCGPDKITVLAYIGHSIEIPLGYNIKTVRHGANNIFAYQQVVRNHTFWYLCKIEDGQIVWRRFFNDVVDINFFDNGSYVIAYRSNKYVVFNTKNEKIFSCYEKKAVFKILGGNYFVIRNCSKRGCYSAENGKQVMDIWIDEIWANGTYLSYQKHLVFPTRRQLNSKNTCSEFKKFGSRYVAYSDGRYTFVLDVNKPFKALYNLISENIEKAEEQFYKDYLYAFSHTLS